MLSQENKQTNKKTGDDEPKTKGAKALNLVSLGLPSNKRDDWHISEEKKGIIFQWF